TQPASEIERAVGVGPVNLPAYLDRHGVVRRTSSNELDVAEFELWGQSLRENFTQVLGRNLEILVNGDVYHVDRASNIRSLTINGSADNEVFSLQTTVRSQFNGRGGNDTLMGANVANRWSITGTNQGSLNGTTRFSSMENLKGGAGADRFMFSSSRLASITGTIRGGGGGDWLDYSRRHTSVHVDLRSRQATSVGRVEGIENVKGGQADDVLIGDSQDNMMFGLGGNDFMAGMDGRDRLYGGSDDDILKGTNGRDILDGGTGNNQLVWT
ncbi:MAG: hypothetical protein GY917_17625, partial [Planctomycetaceae bacterium]|nr:hypothetical protein [Planctomycetaceae bacterium]